MASTDVEPGDVEASFELRDLVEAALDGDQRAWDQLFRALYPRLLAYAKWQVGNEEAADVVSEALLRAVSAMDRFSWKGAGFEAWIFRILRNVIVDGHRRNGRSKRLLGVGEVAHQHDESVDGLLVEEEARSLRTAFRRLDRSDQEVLQLRVVACLSSEETAEVLGKRPGTVRMAQARSLARLRSFLAEEEQRT